MIVASLGIGTAWATGPPRCRAMAESSSVAVARALMSRPAVVAGGATVSTRSDGRGHGTPCGRLTNWGKSVIMVTHDTRTAAYADRVLVCRDGQVVSDLRDVTADSLAASLR